VASTSDELFAAIEAGDTDRVRALVADDPACARSRDAEGVSALLRARYRLDDAMIEAIRPHAGDLDVFEAATFGDVAGLAEVLRGDPSLAGASTGDGFTALHLAAFFDGAGAASALLDAGADPDAHGTGWMTGTALNSAAAARNLPVAEVLLAAGADPGARQGQGWTPLHSAAHNGDVAMIAALRAAGADPSRTNDDGRSAADLATNAEVRANLVG